MAEYRWILHDASGNDLRATEPFDTKDAAEAWMGERWKSLLEEGAEEVSLRRDDALEYRMGLRPA
jgi:hypothetical protein